MRNFMILIVLVGGAVIVQSSAFTQTDQDPNITATESDIFVTPATNPDFFAGFVGGDGDRSIPDGKIDWSIGNCRPFTRPTTEDLVISTCVGDYHNIADLKERMRIRKDGMVGIGTTDPNYRLHVVGSPDDDVILNVTGREVIGSKALFAVRKDSAAGEFGFHTAGKVETDLLRVEETNFYGSLVVIKNNAAIGDGLVIRSGNIFEAGSRQLLLGSYDGATYFVVEKGRVGINTDSPQGALDVNGRIYQRGTLLHADYVFEDDYQLESIEEHAQFIRMKKHLKAIPKAKVDKNGMEIIEVGDHQRGIVKELEKAHIYIEQLHKHIKVLEERFAELEARANAEK